MMRSFHSDSKDSCGDSSHPPHTSSENESDPQGTTATAISDYTANPADPHEISLTRGEELTVVANSGGWWFAIKKDGQKGVAPSNYLLPSLSLGRTLPTKWSAKALFDYTTDPTDPHEISFAKDEVLDVLDDADVGGLGPKWLRVRSRRGQGSVGIAPANYLTLVSA